MVPAGSEHDVGRELGGVVGTVEHDEDQVVSVPFLGTDGHIRRADGGGGLVCIVAHRVEVTHVPHKSEDRLVPLAVHVGGTELETEGEHHHVGVPLSSRHLEHAVAVVHGEGHVPAQHVLVGVDIVLLDVFATFLVEVIEFDAEPILGLHRDAGFAVVVEGSFEASGFDFAENEYVIDGRCVQIGAEDDHIGLIDYRGVLLPFLYATEIIDDDVIVQFYFGSYIYPLVAIGHEAEFIHLIVGIVDVGNRDIRTASVVDQDERAECNRSYCYDSDDDRVFILHNYKTRLFDI